MWLNAQAPALDLARDARRRLSAHDHQHTGARIARVAPCRPAVANTGEERVETAQDVDLDAEDVFAMLESQRSLVIPRRGDGVAAPRPVTDEAVA